MTAAAAAAAVLAALAVWIWSTPTIAHTRLTRLTLGSHRPTSRRATPGRGVPTVAPVRRDVARRTTSGRAVVRSADVQGDGGGGASTAGRGREVAVVAVAVLVGALVVGGVPGAVAGGCAGLVRVVMVRRGESPEAARRRARVQADLPFALDLMVACLRAGLPVGGAVEATASAVDSPVGALLSTVTGRLRLGAGPEEAWTVLRDDPVLSGLAREMTRAALSGAPVADVLTRLADDTVRETRATCSAAARRAGIQVIAPLGLCFLPAFVFLGIIPIVAGLATQAFGH